MIYYNYGIELLRLEKDKIELLRHWRNAPEIVKNMEFQEHITAKMQTNWFSKINNIHNFYFLIKWDKEWVGMINLSSIDYKQKTGEAGIFISNQSYINTSIPAHSSFALLDFAFDDLELKSIHIKVNKKNKKALKYNQHLGFLYTKESSNTDFILMRLSSKHYKRKTARLRATLLKLEGAEKSLKFDVNNNIDTIVKARFFS
ncbi:MAG: RimJ/RimL family protein N-acetyltransferase [Maribacter sp.]|jgi:RimJ/RimL family protein N-acetyltransferase